MKKRFIALTIFLSFFTTLSSVNAYTIGGAYAQLVTCQWGQYGYQYGYIGTYNVNGQTYSQFFGNQYCPY